MVQSSSPSSPPLSDLVIASTVAPGMMVLVAGQQWNESVSLSLCLSLSLSPAAVVLSARLGFMANFLLSTADSLGVICDKWCYLCLSPLCS